MVADFVFLLHHVQDAADCGCHLAERPVVHSASHHLPHRNQLQGHHLLPGTQGQQRSPLLHHSHIALPPGSGGKVGDHPPHVVVAMSLQCLQGFDVEDDSREDGKIVVLDVQSVEGRAEREGGGESGEGIPLQPQGMEVFESADRGREVGQLRVAQIEDGEIRNSPKLKGQGTIR